MIRIQQLKLPVTHTQEELEQKIRKTLKIGKQEHHFNKKQKI